LRRKITTPDLLTEVRNDLIEARHHFEVYRTYMHKRTQKKYRELFLVYRDFFMCGLRGHFAAMVVALGRVFDSDPKNIGIAGLLQTAPDLEKVEEKKLARVRKIWKDQALHLRHEVVAHRPGSSTIEDSFKRANICLNDIGRLIGLSRQLLDTWANKTGCFSHNQSSVTPDLKAVMDTLLRARIERHTQERLQRERARAARRP
jgi:HEPN superfamily AbiU2-like protein